MYTELIMLSLVYTAGCSIYNDVKVLSFSDVQKIMSMYVILCALIFISFHAHYIIVVRAVFHFCVMSTVFMLCYACLYILLYKSSKSISKK